MQHRHDSKPVLDHKHEEADPLVSIRNPPPPPPALRARTRSGGGGGVLSLQTPAHAKQILTQTLAQEESNLNKRPPTGPPHPSLPPFHFIP